MRMSAPRYLYRAFDAAGTLLYVGQSATPLRRRYSHLSGSKWSKDVYEWRITGPFPAEVAVALEAEAILAEQPEYNVVYKRRVIEASAARAT